MKIFLHAILLLSLSLSFFTNVPFAEASNQEMELPEASVLDDHVDSTAEVFSPGFSQEELRWGMSSQPQSQPSILLACVDGDETWLCSDAEPGPVYKHTMTFVDSILTKHHKMRILCEGKDCHKKDVYYRITVNLQWGSRYVLKPTIGAYVSVWRGNDAPGGVYNKSCGSGKTGSCSVEAMGVLPGSFIPYSGPDFSPYHFAFSRKQSGIIYSTTVQTVTVEAAFDPSLLTNPIAETFSLPVADYCTPGATYQQTFASCGDPINTGTGVFTYPVTDLSLQSSAGPIDFQRTYISAFNDTNLSSLGYGWTHNQDVRLVFPDDPLGKPGFVLFKHPDGNLYRFWDKDSGSYLPYAGLLFSLTRSAASPYTYTIRDASDNSYHFDQSGKILFWRNSQGKEILYSYDQDGRLGRVSADADSRYLSFAYDAQGNLTSVSDQASRAVSFAYDQAGNLSTATDVLGQDWHYAYDPRHRLLEAQDADLNTLVRNEYFSPAAYLNFNDFAISNYSNQDASHTMTIEDNGNTLHLVGNTWKKIPLAYTITPDTILEFDFKSGNQGEVHAIGLDTDNSQTKDYTFKVYGTESWGVAEYNNYSNSAPGWKHYVIPVGNYLAFESAYLFFANDHDVSNPTAESYFANVRIYEANPLIGRVTHQYDGAGNLVAALTYNPDGSTTIEDGLGNTRVDVYNEAGVLVETRNPLDEPGLNEYDANFRPTAIANAAGHTLQMAWSADGKNLLSKTDPAGNTTTYTYDALNNLTSTTDPLGNVTAYTYDGTLLTSKTGPDGKTTTYTYTAQGWLETETDPYGRVTTYTYNVHGQKTSVTDWQGRTTTYVYDDLGRLVESIDERGRISRSEYNLAGKLLRSISNYDPNRPQNDQNLYNLTTTYEYDSRGNQVAVTDTLGRVTQYEYDGADRLVRIIDPAGNITTNTYDANGQLVAAADALGNVTTYVYDSTGRRLSTINALGQSSGATTFDIPAYTSTATDALGHSATFHYDELNRVVKEVDPLGNFTTTAYDAAGNVTSRTDQLGRITLYEYDSLGRLVRAIDPLGGVTQTLYDAAGNRAATIDPLGNQTTYTYDSQGRLLTTTDSLGNTTTNQYDADGNLVATTDALGRTTTAEYDQWGQRVATVDVDGQRTTYTYDILGRIISVTDPTGTTTSTYDALGNTVASTDIHGRISTTLYDALGRVVSTTDFNGNTTTSQYDAAGNLVATTDPLGNTTTYTYDALNRRITTTDPLGNISRVVYDALGNLTDEIDARDVVTHYVYDELNRKVVVVYNYRPTMQPNADTNVRIEYTYNAVGNRTHVKDANGNVTEFQYDALNRLTRKIDPLGNTWIYSYDLAGNMVSRTDGNGKTTAFAYNALGQLTLIDYPSPDADVSFAYNALGWRISMQDALGTTAWQYDSLGRMVAVTDPRGKIVRYAYDDQGNRAGLEYPDGRQVAYAYDEDNRLAEVADWDSHTAPESLRGATEYEYDPFGRLLSILRPNAVDSAYAYDELGRLAGLQHVAPGAFEPNLASYEYTYDAVGNLTRVVEDLQKPAPSGPAATETPTATAEITETATTEVTETPTGAPDETPTPDITETSTPQATEESLIPTPVSYQQPVLALVGRKVNASLPAVSTSAEALTIDYTYDSLNRLTSATYSNGTAFHYTYDAAGNVLEYTSTVNGQSSSVQYAYDTANQLLTATKDSTVWYYTYDGNGSLVEVSPLSSGPANGAKRYTYNVAGFLVKVEAYLEGWQPQAEMSYDGLGNRLEMTASANGQGFTTRYELDNGRVLSASANDQTTFYLYGLGQIGELADAWNYPLTDGLNSPRQLVNADGEVTLVSFYTPWGETLETYGQGNSEGYFGGVIDTATGLIYVGNGQYYDPQTGRFLNRDVNPRSPNPYVPWGDPAGALVAPLALLALLYGRRKSRSRWDTLVILLILGLAAGMSLLVGAIPAVSAPLGPLPKPTQAGGGQHSNSPNQPPPNGTPPGPASDPGSWPVPYGMPSLPPTVIICPPASTQTPGSTPTPSWRTLSMYNMSAYYITHETQYYQRNSLSGPIPSLNNTYANKYFLFSKGGVCMQGTGRLKDGRLIGCTKKLNWSVSESIKNEYGHWEYIMPPENPSRESTPFFWKTENDIKDFVAFETVAVCNDGKIPRGSEIRIPGIMETLRKDTNASFIAGLILGKDDVFKVTDVGGALCERGAIDIFIGEQEAASSHRSLTDRAYSAVMRLPNMIVEVK